MAVHLAVLEVLLLDGQVVFTLLPDQKILRVNVRCHAVTVPNLWKYWSSFDSILGVLKPYFQREVVNSIEVELVALVHERDGHGHNHCVEAGAEVDRGREDGVVRPERGPTGVEEAEVTREAVLNTGQHPDQSETSITLIDEIEISISQYALTSLASGQR